MKKYILIWTLVVIYFSTVAQPNYFARIQPCKKNPTYWQYNNEPIILIGGSSNDNLFQNSDVNSELDLLSSLGGNYVRNCMSSLDDGDEKPFWRSGERYNLDKSNKDYWDSLDNFFRLTAEKNIIVQLEVWAFDDFLIGWEKSPWNPLNNNVFTEENSTLVSGNFDTNESINNFFKSVPKLNNDSLLLEYQKRFVNQVLTISLKYNHIIYCVTDNMSPQYSMEWGSFWAEYIRKTAMDKGIAIELAETLLSEDVLGEKNNTILNNPETYSFVDVSQNSLTTNETHWQNIFALKEAISENPRPLNNVKVVGGQMGEWTDGPSHGIERFWRNLIAGLASSRFEEEPIGLGLSERAQMHLKSAKMLISEYDFITSVPDEKFSLILERVEDEAYLARNADHDVIVYFTDGGQIVLDFTDFEGDYKLKWLNLEGANWNQESNLEGGGILELTSPYAGNWVALLSKIKDN